MPHTPAWSPILQIAQTLWSTILIFLFLLALRNQFKMKLRARELPLAGGPARRDKAV